MLLTSVFCLGQNTVFLVLEDGLPRRYLRAPVSMCKNAFLNRKSSQLHTQTKRRGCSVSLLLLFFFSFLLGKTEISELICTVHFHISIPKNMGLEKTTLLEAAS